MPDDAQGTIDVAVVRVFTDAGGGYGNELGVIVSSDASRGREQAIAAELGFSETVFVDEVSSGGKPASATVSIFTPASELPFAGHPSVGVAWWLRERGEPVGLLREKAGDVAVEHDAALTWVTAEADWAPVFSWLPLATPAEVDALDASAFADRHHYAYAWIDEARGILRSRMFAPDLGIPEDEATGAAAVRVTALLGRDLEIHQGRGSVIHSRLVPGSEKIQVGGAVVSDRSLRLEAPSESPAP